MRRALFLMLLIWASLCTTQAMAASDSAAGPIMPSQAAIEAIEEAAALESKDMAAIPADELADDIVPLTREELAKLAEEALQLARERTVALVDERKANPRTEEAADPPEVLAARIQTYDDRMQRLLAQRAEAFKRLDIILEEWEEKGGDPERIADYRAYRRAVISDSVSNLTLGGAWQALRRWAGSEDGGLNVLKGLALFVVSVVLLFYVARLIQAIARRTMSHRNKASLLLQTFMAVAIYWAIVLVGLVLVIASLGFDVTPAFAVLGGISFVLAFALQETLGNFAAGLMILIYRPFDQGERITATGVTGKVRNLNLTSTILVTPDNQLVTIPNSKVWNNVIVNADDLEQRRVDLTFIIRDARQALAVLDGLPKMLAGMPHVLDDRRPECYFGGFDGRGAQLQVRPWVESAHYWPARRAITQAIMAYFVEQGIQLWVPPIEDCGPA